MKNKNNFNKILVLSIATFVIFSIFACAFATTGVIRDPNPALPVGGDSLETFTTNVIGAMMWIGYSLAVGMVVFIGIKYIIASADEKASMKGMLVKVFIGSFIIVFAVTITNMVIDVFS